MPKGVEGEAGAPGQLAAREWGKILRRAGGHFMTARLPILSVGIAFFAVLSIALTPTPLNEAILALVKGLEQSWA